MKENKEEIIKSLTEQEQETEQIFEELMTRKDKKREKKEQAEQIEKKKEKEKESKLPKKEKKKVEKSETEPSKKERMKEEMKKIEKGKKKNKLQTLNIVISFLTITCGITYLLYILILGTKLINQPFLILTSTFLIILATSHALATLLVKTEPKKIMNAITNVLFASFIIFNLLVSADILKIPTQRVIGDLQGKSINEVIKWTSQNNIKLKQTYEYSDSIDENRIISQDQNSDTLVKEIDTLSVIVSDGPNLESIVNIPNMVGWNVDDVVKVIKEKKLSNIQIEFNFSDLTKDTEYEQSKSGDIRRNEELILKFSLGRIEDLKPVPLKDLKNMEEFDAVLWLKRNGIKYEITYEFDEKIEKGKVISTNPIKETVIDQNTTTVKVVISKGKKIVAPDLTKMTLEEIADWAIQNGVIIAYDSEFSETVKKDQIIRVSINPGDVVEENATIYVITSKGALKMLNYKENDLEAIRNFAKTYEITLTETEAFSNEVEKGKIISISHKPGDVINNGQNIEVIISLGSEIEIPSFIGMDIDNAKNTCSNIKLDCTISYVYSTSTKNTVIYQNKNAGSKVTQGTNIVLTVSNGVSTSNGNNYTPPTTNPSTPNVPTTPETPNPPVVTPDPPACESKFLGNLVIQEGWLSIGSSSRTITSLRNNLSANYSGATFNITTLDHNSMNSGMIHPSSPANTGTAIYSCQTYTIYVVE